jgi:hypothetical protein
MRLHNAISVRIVVGLQRAKPDDAESEEWRREIYMLWATV